MLQVEIMYPIITIELAVKILWAWSSFYAIQLTLANLNFDAKSHGF